MTVSKKHWSLASMDGVNVLFNEPGTQQGHPAECTKGNANQEKMTPYKNAMVDIISVYGEVRECEKCPERLDGHDVSHMSEDRVPAFKKKFEGQVNDGAAQCSDDFLKVILCDGACEIWNSIDYVERFDAFEERVDYWHAASHLSPADEAKAWYEKLAKKLREEPCRAQGVSDSISYYTTHSMLRGRRLKDLCTQRTFFARNKHQMTYADFRHRGVSIGSAPAETACMSSVKGRLGRSGIGCSGWRPNALSTCAIL